MNYIPLNGARRIYHLVRNRLCSNLMFMTDTTIRDESDGLDLYIDISYLNNGTRTNSYDSSTNFFSGRANKQSLYLVFGFKKKSSPDC